jgi:Lrp/AsnC family transcriptional regulator, regulator for asnA, asnC and gidA
MPNPGIDRRPAVPTTLDELDTRLLGLLEAEPRASLRALARGAGVAPGTVAERLERLRARGVIRGVHLEIDPAALGLGLAVILGIRVAQGRTLSSTAEALLRIPWVREVHVVTGQWDLVVFLAVRDQRHLLEVLEEEVWKLPGFAGADSLVVLDTLQRHSPWLGLSPPSGGSVLPRPSTEPGGPSAPS